MYDLILVAELLRMASSMTRAVLAIYLILQGIMAPILRYPNALADVETAYPSNKI